MITKHEVKKQFIGEVIEVYPGLIVLILKDKRKGQYMQQLVEYLKDRGIETNPSVVVVDATDIRNIDINTAMHLRDMVTSLLNLGTEVILAEVHFAITRSLEGLGVSRSVIKSFPSLADGLWIALDMLDGNVCKRQM